MTLSELLLAEMQKRSQNRAQFAKMLDIHQTQLARLLNPKPGQVPRLSTLKNLSEKLGRSESELISLCYGNAVNDAHDTSKSHDLKYGNCYELIDKSTELTPRAIAEELCRQDNERYHPHPDYEGTPEQWQSIFEAFPDSTAIFYFERNTDGKPTVEIVGDFSIVFFDVDGVKIEDRMLKDGNIKIDKLRAMTVPGECDAVILNMSLINRYNTPDYISTLIKCFENKLQYFKEHDIKINNLYANVYPRDMGLYRSLGFQKFEESAELPTPKDGRNIPLLFKMEKVFDSGLCREQEDSTK